MFPANNMTTKNQYGVKQIKSKKSKKFNKKSLQIGTWNIRLGIHDQLKINDIIDALVKTKADILGIQETGAREDIFEYYNEYFLFAPKSSRNEGLGFIIKKSFIYHIETIDCSIPRIFTITFSSSN